MTNEAEGRGSLYVKTIAIVMAFVVYSLRVTKKYVEEKEGRAF